MHKLSVLGALCATVKINFSIATAAAAGIAPLSGFPGPGAPGPDRAVLLVGGMGGGGAGMGGGGAGMGGGGAGMGGGGAGMGGSHFGVGEPFGRPNQNFGQPIEDQPGNEKSSDYYTYQCITLARRCPFVAPASLRSNSLRSGADCVCPGGQSKGRIE
jgi:hypothetical protein